MPNSKKSPTIKLPQVKQLTGSHCGPATLELLYSYLNRKISQEDVVKAVKLQTRIKEDGTRPRELARAVKRLTPKYQFWFKNQASPEDLDLLINKYHYPVGINWQGLFYDSVEEEARLNPRGDHGHYSVVVKINLPKDEIQIVDPYPEYAAKPRKFSLSWFISRWWDEVEDKDPKTGKFEITRTDQLLFVVVPKTKTIDPQLGLMRPSQLSILSRPAGFSLRLPQFFQNWKRFSSKLPGVK